MPIFAARIPGVQFFPRPTIASEQIPQASGTAIGDLTGNGGLAAAFDGVTDQHSSNCASIPTAATTGFIGKTLASSSAIHHVDLWGSNNHAYEINNNGEMTLNLRAKTGAAPANSADGTLLGTLTFDDGPLNPSASEIEKSITSDDTATAYDHVWVELTAATSENWAVAELEIWAPA